MKFIAIKFAKEIVKEIQKRGSIKVPEGAVTGEAFEEWLRREEIMIKSSNNEGIFKKSRSELNSLFNERE